MSGGQQHRTLEPWRGPGELAVDGWAAVAYPGVVVAQAGSRVCAVDGGLVIALAGSRVWAWDGGVVHAQAGSEVDAGPYGRVDAQAGARVTAEGPGTWEVHPSWPMVVSRGAWVSVDHAIVEAAGGSYVVARDAAQLVLHGWITGQTIDGRRVNETRTDEPMPALLVPEPSRLAGRRVLLAEPLWEPGEPASKLGPPQSVLDWLEPLLDVLRAQGLRVADQWTPRPPGLVRLFAGRIRPEEVARLLAVPHTVVPIPEGRNSVGAYGSSHGVYIEPGRVPRRWPWRSSR